MSASFTKARLTSTMGSCRQKTMAKDEVLLVLGCDLWVNTPVHSASCSSTGSSWEKPVWAEARRE